MESQSVFEIMNGCIQYSVCVPLFTALFLFVVDARGLMFVCALEILYKI